MSAASGAFGDNVSSSRVHPSATPPGGNNLASSLVSDVHGLLAAHA
jgi:hypothetical protein